MTQPPDEREGGWGDATDPVPGAPAGLPSDSAPDAPTVPWTPPDGAPQTAPPLTPTAGAPWSDGPSSPPPPDAYDAPSSGPAPADRPNPLISWSPSGTTGGSTPLADGAAPVGPVDAGAAPLVGWQVQPIRTVETPQGFVLAGIFPRLVAYLIDTVLSALVPTLLALVLIDYGPILRDIERAVAQGQTGVPTTPTVFPLTLEVVLTTLISTAFSYLYFVGFWTSGGQATPGMRGLRMRVVDVVGGTTMSLTDATKRWIGLGAPLGLLALIGPLQSVAGLIQFAVSLLLLITAATDDRKQGLHDRWANSVVIRARSSQAGATAVGCVVLVLLWIAFGVLVFVVGLNAVLPELGDIFERAGGAP